VIPRFIIEPLSKSHDRSGFSCGIPRIDDYFRNVVSQDLKRNYASCFVALEAATGKVAGFYTLSSSNIPLADIPADLARKLPRYPTVPAVLIGWLGRDLSLRGANLGPVLLFDAIKTVASAPIGAHAIFAHAVDEKAAAFYEGFQFTRLTGRPSTLYIPLSTALRLLEI
jgi:hypothetical protein